MRAHWHQHIYTEVRDELQRRMSADDDASFLLSYSQVYGQAQLVRIRRLTDPHADSASLRALIVAIRGNREVITIDRHAERRRDLDDARMEWQESYADESGRLQRDILDGHLLQLDGLEDIKTHIDKRVVHLDRAVALPDVTHDAPIRSSSLATVRYQDIRRTLAALGDITNFYLALLTGIPIGDWTPVLLEDWHAPLRNGLFGRA